MGTPAQPYLSNDTQGQQPQVDPTQDLESRVTPSANTLGQALQNQQQQPQQQPPANNAQNAGPVKTGLREVLGGILKNFTYGGGQAMIKAAGGETDAEKAIRLASTNESQARTGQYNAQAADLQSQATLRTAQAKPRVLMDPSTGGPSFSPDGSVRTGTLDDQKELNELYKVTGGYINVPDSVAASIGMPELAGKPMPATTFNTIMSSQSSKTIESEIARLSQYHLSKGDDPNTSPDVQSLIQIRRHMQNFTPEQSDEQYRELYAKAHGGGKLSPGEQAWMQGYEHQKVLVPQARVQLQLNGGGLIPQGGQQQGTADISQVPSQIKGQVQSILDYRQPMPPMGRNNPTNHALQYWVNALDPTYDATTYPARSKIINDYTSGPESKTINAIGTAIGHGGDLYAASKAVEQNNLPLLNSIANKFGLASGSDAQSVYKLIANRFSSEVSAAYVQNGGTGQERGANESDFDLSKGAKQIQSNIAESAHLLRSKLSAQEQQWNTTFRPTRPEDQFESRFLTPAARQTLNELSAQAPTSKTPVMMKAPNGQQKPVPPDQVEHYKSLGATVVNQ